MVGSSIKETLQMYRHEAHDPQHQLHSRGGHGLGINSGLEGHRWDDDINMVLSKSFPLDGLFTEIENASWARGINWAMVSTPGVALWASFSVSLSSLSWPESHWDENLWCSFRIILKTITEKRGSNGNGIDYIFTFTVKRWGLRQWFVHRKCLNFKGEKQLERIKERFMSDESYYNVILVSLFLFGCFSQFGWWVLL